MCAYMWFRPVNYCAVSLCKVICTKQLSIIHGNFKQCGNFITWICILFFNDANIHEAINLIGAHVRCVQCRPESRK